MDIIIRKIGDKNNRFVFLPNAKSGFRFSEDLAEPVLSPFQQSCIQLAPQKSKKKGCFWTPNFCYVGTLVAKEGGFLLDELLKSNRDNIKEFNKHFPSKNWYWYNKAKRQNIAVQTFFAGVRAVSAIIVCYYDLMRVGRVADAHKLYEKHLRTSGIARLLETSNSQLITDVDRTHNLLIEDGNFILVAKNDFVPVDVVENKRNAASSSSTIKKQIKPAEVTTPVSASAIKEHKQQERKERVIAVEEDREEPATNNSFVDRGIATRPRLPKIANVDKEGHENNHDNEATGRRKNPFKLSTVGKQ